MKRLWGMIQVFALMFVLGVGVEAALAQEASQREVRAKKGASKLWAETCMRCHDIRSPSTYSDREWDLIMHHMRVRANLTKEEYDTIREYLKSGN